MVDKEDIHNIPLRKEWLKAPSYRRSKKAIAGIKNYLKKHYRNQQVKIGKYLNLLIWSRGNKNPPAHVTVKVTKEKDFIKVELPDAPIEEKPKEKKKGLATKIKEKVIGEKPKEEEKKEVKKLEKKEEKELEEKFQKQEDIPKEKPKDEKQDSQIRKETIVTKQDKKGPTQK